MNNKNVLSAQDVIDEIQDLDSGFALIEDLEENQKMFYNKQQTVLEFASALAQDELIQVVEHFAEAQSAYTAAPLLQLLTAESKTKLIDSSSFDLNVALVGEYGSHHWIEALKAHMPEILKRRVEWAVKAVEEDLLNYKEIKDKLPDQGNMRQDVFTYRVKVQEKVLWSFRDSLTFRQLERYMNSVSSVQRPAHFQLQTLYEEKRVSHEQGVFEKDVADICEQRTASGQVIVSRKNYKI